MLRDQLNRQGFAVGRRHVRTLMLRMGIEALTPQPGTSQAAPGHDLAPVPRASDLWVNTDERRVRWARKRLQIGAIPMSSK